MATVTSGTTNHWRSYLTYTVTDNGDSVTISAVGGFESIGWGFQLTGVSATLSCTGQASKTASGNVSTATGATKKVQLASTSWTIAKGSTAKSVTVACKVVNATGYMNATLTASTTVTIPAKEGYTVTYNANGGSGAPSSQSKTAGTALTLSTQIPYRSGYTFEGWGTSASATTATYQPGSTYSTDASITLYAVWAVAYGAPTIKSLSAERCYSNGVFYAFGTYAKVTFDWTCEASVASIVISYGAYSASVSANGTEGSSYKVVGGSFDTNSSYTITVTVTDSEGNSASASCPLGTGVFAWSVYKGGSGFAVGKNAERSGFDCGFNNAYFHNIDASGDLNVDGDMSVGGSFSPSSVSTGNLSADGVIHLADDGTSSDGVNVGGSSAPIRITGSNASINTPNGYFYLNTSEGCVRSNNKKAYFTQYGSVNVTPTANTPTPVEVTFPYAFSDTPRVTAIPVTTVPGTSVLGVGVQSVSPTGCTFYLTRNSTTPTGIYWIASGPM